jgi:glycosyltransferase involved in cell wall biosynthesis
VVEPLLAGVPVIASSVGGLPEVVVDGHTGRLVHARRPTELAQVICDALDDYPRFKQMALEGQQLVTHMMDVRRTTAEINAIYAHVLDAKVSAPARFDPVGYLRQPYSEADPPETLARSSRST